MRTNKHKSTVKSLLKGFTVTILIITATVCVAVAVLFMLEHSSTTGGGLLYTLLPAFRQDTAETIAFAEPETTSAENHTPATTNPPRLEVPAQQAQLPPIEPVSPPPSLFPSTATSEQNYLLAMASPFAEIPFFIPKNAPFYAYFYYENPDISPETAVWMVNAHLHIPFFSYIRINNGPNPLLVNAFYRLPPGFAPYSLVPVNSATCFLLATPETVTAFRAMREYARENYLDLSATSAFRTAEHQAELFAARNFVDGVVARPYHSEHQTGRALDLWGPHGLLDAHGPTRTGTWVAQNAHLFGFIIRYRADTTHITGFIYEPWHITYVGVDISMYMYENHILSLEEFVARNPGRD